MAASALMPPRGVYAILNAAGLTSAQLRRHASDAVDGGAVLLQYRHKGQDDATRQRGAQAVLHVTRTAGVPLLINDDVALSARIGAQGVHLGRGDTGIRQARAALGPSALIGATCHDCLAAAEQALAQGADYVSFGRFFASRTKPEAPAANIETLRQASARLPCPVGAIGGINADNGALLLAAGADLLAVAAAIFQAADPRAATGELAKLFQEI